MKSLLVFWEVSQGVCSRVVDLIRRLVFLPRSFVLRCAEVEGILKTEACVSSWAYVGEGESYEYLKKLYFQEVRSQKFSSVPLVLLRKKIGEARNGRSILFIEANRLLKFLLPPQGFRTYPWIRQRVFLKGEAFAKRRHYIEENYGRKVRKYRYTRALTRERDAVKRFYAQLYVPYMAEKFKDLSHARSLDEFLLLLPGGFLLEVLEDGVCVAGIMCHRDKRAVTAFAFGLAPDYTDRLRRGALSAAYYFLFQWAQENGLEAVDLLRSRPHICDGVYEHKKRWGAVAVDDGWSHAALWIYPSRQAPLPGIFAGTLVRRGNGFMELGKVSGFGSADEAPRVGYQEAHRA